LADNTTQAVTAPRTWQDVIDTGKRGDVPAGLWMRCPSCESMSYRKQVEQNLHVCPDCDHHYRIDADERVRQLCDPGSFEELWADLSPSDPLKFTDRVPYRERLKAVQKQTGRKDALVCGKAFIKGRGVILAVMGSAVGLGNFLRFPGQAAQNGAGAFMIPYFVALLLVGIPLA